MSERPGPTVSVVIATYNWSAALRLAIKSVLLQTFQDFEVLVVGDACTDDSSEVVASFGDPRICWHNLEQNNGSQWAPNNHGLRVARAEYVAYLGHDDIWHPAHLETCVATARARSADVVCSVLVMYGPPRSKLRSLTGLFVDGQYNPSQFMPPSSILHRRALIETIGPWRDPESIDIPVDHDFLYRAYSVGATFSSTEEITAFKFNSAWRRGAYRKLHVDEQLKFLKLIESGADFRALEMKELLRAAIEGRLIEVRGCRPGKGLVGKQELAENRHFKASLTRSDPADCPLVTVTQRFTIPDQFAPFEWHEIERHPVHGPYRWTGPHLVSSFEVPVIVERPVLGRLTVIGEMEPRIVQELKLSVEGRDVVPYCVTKVHDVTYFSFRFPWQEGDKPWTRPLVSIEVPYVKRPCDVMVSDDSRWLGVAVSSLEVRPDDDSSEGSRVPACSSAEICRRSRCRS